MLVAQAFVWELNPGFPATMVRRGIHMSLPRPLTVPGRQHCRTGSRDFRVSLRAPCQRFCATRLERRLYFGLDASSVGCSMLEPEVRVYVHSVVWGVCRR